MKAIRRVLTAGICWWGACLATDAVACPVPVYEVASQRWQPEDYQVTVEYCGALSNAPAKAVDTLRAQDAGNPGRANLRADLRKAEGGGGDGQPVMRVSYIKHLTPPGGLPDMRRERAPGVAWTNVVWSGPFTEEGVTRLLDSPARREIKRRLLAGEVAVWVLLESGDRAMDDRVAGLAEETFRDIRANMKTPPAPALPYAEPLPAAAGEKPIALSLIRVPRGQPDEEFLAAAIRQLFNNPASDHGPLLAPVFGRGMVLQPLSGADITPEAIKKVMGALVEHCSCVSSLPGQARFLLMGGPWDRGGTPK